MFITLTLTRTEAETLQRRMRLTCMNEVGSDADIACGIEQQLSAKLNPRRLSHFGAQVAEIFADLYPAGGRE